MLLIITNKEDYTADFLINKLNNQNLKYYRFNTEDLFGDCNVDISISKGSLKVNLPTKAKIRSVWFRRVKFPILDDSLSSSQREYMYSEIGYLFKNLWETIEAKWLSIPHCIYRAESKLLQLKLAGEIGFFLPETLISSDAENIRSFYERFNKSIIVKPLFNNRYRDNNLNWLIFTNKLSDENFSKLTTAAPLHSIYQEYIVKQLEVRVTVVEEKVFAASVDSQSYETTRTDWRKKKLKFESHTLPEEIVAKCVTLVKALNLKFGAIDLILTPDNKYVFLEINPNGQWAWIESDTGQKISQAIIKHCYD